MANFQAIKKTQDLIISISWGNKEEDTPYRGILIFPEVALPLQLNPTG